MCSLSNSWRLETAIFAFPLARCRRLTLYLLYLLDYGHFYVEDYDVQPSSSSAAPQLEPAFEHLLRNSIDARKCDFHTSCPTKWLTATPSLTCSSPKKRSLRARQTWASILWPVVLPHKREFARVVTAWKTAKIMAETKLQTDAVTREHGVPVTLLPCDWTSIITEFKKKYRNHIADERLLAQSMFEHFSEKLADGTLKAEPLSYVVSLFEEEQQERSQARPSPPIQSTIGFEAHHHN